MMAKMAAKLSFESNFEFADLKSISNHYHMTHPKLFFSKDRLLNIISACYHITQEAFAKMVFGHELF